MPTNTRSPTVQSCNTTLWPTVQPLPTTTGCCSERITELSCTLEPAPMATRPCDASTWQPYQTPLPGPTARRPCPVTVIAM